MDISNYSKQIDGLETTDLSKVYEKPFSIVASSPPRKISVKKDSSFLSNGGQAATIWRQSSMSLTRQKSPSHKIPATIRFKSKAQDELKHHQYMTLELTRDIKTKKGTRFPIAHRPEHFVKGLGELGPSPATYQRQQVNQESQYSSLRMTAWSTSKGRSFSMFNNHHKTYLPHTQHRFYQPENLKDQPGPGKYENSWVTKPKKQSYSMRVTLRKFNETKSQTPGPGAYGNIYSERICSPNVQGTLAKSQRTYLTKFQRNPSPNHYDVRRFLETN